MLITQSKPLTYKELEELKKSIEDIYFFSTFIYVRHPVRGKVKFDLYPFQRLVIFYFLTKRFNIVKKFRQAGLTELISMFALWLANFFPNKNIQIISIKDRVAKRVLGKIKYMYRNLPDHLKTPIVNGRGVDIGTATEMEFSNGSIITSIPTTEDAGRSEALTLLIIDEGAIVRWASKIWAAAFPTLSTGGSAIVNSCVTGDTVIIGKGGNFRIDSICPEHFGKKNISNLGIEVLSHTGKWQRVLGSVNKGQLETWEIQNKFGGILKCTPNHRLLTSEGWATVKDIIENDKYIITYDTGVGELEEPPITIPPKVEILKPIPGFPNYKISNLGRVFIVKGDKIIEKEGSINNWGYRAIGLWDRGVKKKFMVCNLVSTAFIGYIPEGYITDHIDCDKSHDYVTNLQIITIAENGQRAAKYSRGMKIGGKIGKGFANLRLIAQIREAELRGELRSNIADRLGIPRAYVTRTLDNTRVKGVQISKLTLIHKYLDTIYDICVEGDESYICNSLYINHNTPYGIGNWYHNTWVEALSGGNPFNAINLKWQMHPERDIKWYREMRQALGPRRTAQEIDGDFLSSGDSVFDLLDIKAIEDSLEDFEIIEKRLNGSLLIFEKPQIGNSYYIGADVSSGRSRDYAAFSIMDKWGDEKACFKGKIAPNRFADLLMKVGTEYNTAVIAPESNDIGLATTSRIQDEGYKELYYTTQILKEKGEAKPKVETVPGWLTTKKNRPVIIDELETDIRMDNVIIKDPFFVQEAYTFIYDNTNKAVAMGKDKKRGNQGEEELDEETYTDDSVIAKSITNHIRKRGKSTVIIAPR